MDLEIRKPQCFALSVAFFIIGIGCVDSSTPSAGNVKDAGPVVPVSFTSTATPVYNGLRGKI